MRKTFTLLLLLAYALLTSTSLQAQGERLYSPDGKLLVPFATLWVIMTKMEVSSLPLPILG